MHFCEKCENMLYIKISDSDSNTLLYFCRNCGNENTTIKTDNISISKMVFNSEEESHDLFINEYTKLDPTIPRIKTINCPNADCI